MRFDRLDLNLLVALEALLDERNISRAAERLFVTQPAMSGALSRLREFFSDELLVQVGRQMVPTPLAEELGESARQALMFIRSRITTPTAFDPATTERRFAIMASDYALDVLLSKTLARAAAVAPAVRFSVQTPETGWLALLERGTLDLFLSVGSYCSEDHPRLELFVDEHALICWNEGRYARSLTLDEYLEARHAVVTFGPERFPAFSETFLTQRGVKRHIDISVPYFGALPMVVLGTDRVAIMHRRHAEHFARYLPLCVHPMPIETPPIQEFAQWHTVRQGDKGVQWLLGLLKEVADKA